MTTRELSCPCGLTFTGADACAEIWLNGRLLGRHEGALDPFEYEVTDLLKVRNELAVEVESPHDNGGLWGEVALEVRCPAFLRAMRVWVTSANAFPRCAVVTQEGYRSGLKQGLGHSEACSVGFRHQCRLCAIYKPQGRKY